ncbi:dynamin family protein [Speluncibacter jeojiensis]|uniref:Dynamin family protein n=1 Tax=Speluncibacter jeojiensis TaxID=2710754 RepID=A0A9X4RI14_9ACTN|nr:dynamin family protein [Corynebacteriales bacterium D3-21]
MTGPTDPKAQQLQAMVQLLDQTGQVARVADRSDLVDRLEAAKTRVTDPRLRVVIVGALKQGKSQLVNSLLGVQVCSVGDDETTAVITVIQYGPQASAELVLEAGPEAEPLRVPLPLDEVVGITPDTPRAEGRRVLRVEVSVPSPVLAEGLVLVDTPGVGGKGNPYAASTLNLLPTADAVLWVCDASQECTEPEVRFVRQVLGICPSVACVVTKTDLYPDWRAVVGADHEHLQRGRLAVPLLPVSSLLREHAVRLGDESLNAESGFLDLFAFLRASVANSDVNTRKSVALDVEAVADHVALGLTTELATLRDPDRAAQRIGDLERTRVVAEQLQRKSSLWQQTLADGIADLATDIDHDLRDRLRRVTREAEAAVDEGDPEKEWTELGAWLEDQIATAVGDNFVWAHERSVWLAQKVAEHFADAGAVDLPHVDGSGAESDSVHLAHLADLEAGRVGITQKVLIGMRGSYGGVLMFGLVTTLMGMALVNPISLGAGVLLGTKAYREDKANRVERRRIEAKNAIRRYTDEVSFQVNKESKDRLRLVQRALRDHFQSVAEQTLRSLSESVRAAQEAVTLDAQDRDARMSQIDRQLQVLGEMKHYAMQIGSVELPAAPTAVAR